MIPRKIAIVIFAIGLIASFVLLRGGNGSLKEKTGKEYRKTVEVVTVSQEDFLKTAIRAKGVVKPKNYTLIRSLTSGVVQYLAPVGKKVSKGEALFSLADSNIQNTYTSSLGSLNAAQQSLEQTRILNQETENQGKLSVASAQEAMKLAESNLEITERQAQQMLKSSQENARITYEMSYTLVDQILRFLGQGSLDEYAFINFPTLETQARSNAQGAFIKAKKIFDTLPSSPEQSNLLDHLNRMSELVGNTKRALDYTFTVMSFGVADVIGQSLPQSLIDFYTTQIVSYQNQLNVQKGAIQRELNSLDDIELAAQAQVTQARSQAELARIQYTNAKSAFDASNRSARLRELGAESQLAGARIQFSGASSQYQNLSLPSSFSGVVISHRVNLFDQVIPGREMIELGSSSVVEIEVSLDAKEAQYMTHDQQALVNNEVEALVSEVAPLASLESGKVLVTIQADNTKGKLSPGVVAEVVFEVDFPQKNVLSVPLSSVTIAQDETYVLVVEEERVKKRPVTLGEMFGSSVIVQSGLQTGDQVIVKNGALVKEGESVFVK